MGSNIDVKTVETAGTESGTRPGSAAVKLRRDLGAARGIHLHLFFSLGNSCLSSVRGAFPQKAGRNGPASKIFCLKYSKTGEIQRDKAHAELWWLRNLSAAQVYLGRWLRREGFSVGRAEVEEDAFK